MPVRFLIALRDDALAGLDRFKGRIPDLFDNYLRLDRLGEHAAREAIEGPVRHWNSVSPEPMELEEGLADEVLRQLVGGDDAVPTAATPVGGAQIEPAHLQLAMTRLWEAETEAGSRVLRLATLESLGGAAAIVRNNVQAAMSSLPPRDQRLAAQVVRFLVTPSGAKVRHVPGDLAEYAGRPEPQVRALLERLSSGGLRILRPAPPPPGSTAPAAYEVFHDVLSRPLLEWRLGYERERLEVRARRLSRALVAVTAVAISMAVYLFNPGFMQRLELDTVDLRFDVRGESAPPRDIVMVAVDDATLRPYDGILPRALHGRLINRVNAAEPRAIAEDITFGGPKPGDGVLIRALERARSRLVLATPLDYRVLTDEDGGKHIQFGPVLGETEFFAEHGIQPGWTGLPVDDDDVVRRSTTRSSPNRTRASPRSRRPRLGWRACARVSSPAAPSGGRPMVSRPIRPGSTTTARPGRSGPSRLATSCRAAVTPTRSATRSSSSGSFRASSRRTGIPPPWTTPWRAPRSTPTRSRRCSLGPTSRDVSRVVDVLLIVALGLIPLVAWTLRSRLTAAALIVGAALVFAAAAYLLFASGWIVAVVAPLAALALASLGILLVEAVQPSMRRRAR